MKGRRLDRLEFNFWILDRFFNLRKGQQITAECSPRAELNVDVRLKNVDVQRLSISWGLRYDPKYSSCVKTKPRQKCRVL